MNKNKERMNNIEKQVEYFVETYGHAPEEAAKKICALFSVSRLFYCQSEIEGNRKCKHQCDHCKEYYKPLEQ